MILLKYDNVKVYSETTSILIDNLSILLVPWINSENEEKTLSMIKESRSPVCMGHLELHGFKVNDYVVMEHGSSIDPFSKFEKVYSGHFIQDQIRIISIILGILMKYIGMIVMM